MLRIGKSRENLVCNKGIHCWYKVTLSKNKIIIPLFKIFWCFSLLWKYFEQWHLKTKKRQKQGASSVWVFVRIQWKFAFQIKGIGDSISPQFRIDTNASMCSVPTAWHESGEHWRFFTWSLCRSVTCPSKPPSEHVIWDDWAHYSSCNCFQCQTMSFAFKTQNIRLLEFF